MNRIGYYSLDRIFICPPLSGMPSLSGVDEFGEYAHGKSDRRDVFVVRFESGETFDARLCVSCVFPSGVLYVL